MCGKPALCIYHISVLVNSTGKIEAFILIAISSKLSSMFNYYFIKKIKLKSRPLAKKYCVIMFIANFNKQPFPISYPQLTKLATAGKPVLTLLKGITASTSFGLFNGTFVILTKSRSLISSKQCYHCREKRCFFLF